MMTYSTPAATSISADSSPVYAPDAAQCTFSAPTWMFEPSAAALTAAMSTAGTHTTTSQLASFTRGFKSLTSAAASAGVLFIFQLPAIIALRIPITS